MTTKAILMYIPLTLIILSLQGCVTAATKEDGVAQKVFAENNIRLGVLVDTWRSENIESVALAEKYGWSTNGNPTLTQKMNSNYLNNGEKDVLIRGVENWDACCIEESVRLQTSHFPAPYSKNLVDINNQDAVLRGEFIVSLLQDKITIGDFVREIDKMKQKFSRHKAEIFEMYDASIKHRDSAERAEFRRNFFKALVKERAKENTRQADERQQAEDRRAKRTTTTCSKTLLNKVVCTTY